MLLATSSDARDTIVMGHAMIWQRPCGKGATANKMAPMNPNTAVYNYIRWSSCVSIYEHNYRIAVSGYTNYKVC